MKIYDLVKKLLEVNPELRDSDKKLIWSVWYKEGYVTFDSLSKENFINRKCTTPESITRAGRKVREMYPHLRGSEPVENSRAAKAEEKGTFIYREDALKKQKRWVFEDGEAREVE